MARMALLYAGGVCVCVCVWGGGGVTGAPCHSSTKIDLTTHKVIDNSNNSTYCTLTLKHMPCKHHIMTCTDSDRMKIICHGFFCLFAGCILLLKIYFLEAYALCIFSQIYSHLSPFFHSFSFFICVFQNASTQISAIKGNAEMRQKIEVSLVFTVLQFCFECLLLFFFELIPPLS